MCDFQANNFELVSVPIGAKTKIGDIEILRGKMIQAIEVYKAGKVAQDEVGTANVADATIAASFLSLAQKGTDRPISSLPLTALVRSDNDGKLLQVDNKIYDWVNSTVSCSDSSQVTSDAGKTWILGVYYTDPLVKTSNC